MFSTLNFVVLRTHVTMGQGSIVGRRAVLGWDCTSLPQLSVAAVTHLGHPVFEVLEGVLVPGAASADNLQRGDRITREGQDRLRGGPTQGEGDADARGCTHLPAGMAVVSPKREGEVGRAVHAHHHVRHGHQGGSFLSQTNPQLLPGLQREKHITNTTLLHGALPDNINTYRIKLLHC